MNDLQSLDAIASEHGDVVAFRTDEETGDFEPVLLRVGNAGVGAEGAAMTLAITDRNGMSLGRYVMSAARLDQALEAQRFELDNRQAAERR